MRLIQIKAGRGRQVVAEDGGEAWIVKGYSTVYDLALAAIRKKTTLAKLVSRAGKAGKADPAALLAAGRVLPPIDHPDPAHLFVTGTGLTHLGSAATRDAMHNKVTSVAEEDADRLDEDVPDGARGRQAEAGQDRRPAGMVLQGRRIVRRRTGLAARFAGLRRGRRRGARGRRHLCRRERRRRPGALASRFSTSSPTT